MSNPDAGDAAIGRKESPLGRMMFRFSVIVQLAFVMVALAENGMLDPGMKHAVMIALLFGIGSVFVDIAVDVWEDLWSKVGESNA